MRELPIVFPISLGIIVLLLVFTSAYAISSNTYANEQTYAANITSGNFGGSAEQAPERAFYQQAAFAVCPLH